MAAKSTNPAQLSLIDPDSGKARARPGRRHTGRHERALNKAVDELPELAKPVMAAAVSLARALACAMDRAELDGKGYETSQLAGQYQNQLGRLGLMPPEGGGDSAADGLDFGGPE